MRKYRPEENAVLIWNPHLARTAYVSGEELLALELWTKGKGGGFTNRLEKLGLLDETDQQAVAGSIARSREIKAPQASTGIAGTAAESGISAINASSFCAPESLHIELTSLCPLACPQCYKGAAGHESLDYGFLSSIIRQAGEMQVFQIALGGGEPLGYPMLAELVQFAAERGMAVSITTSGYGLDSSFLEELFMAGLGHIQISLNGSSEKVNAKSRNGYEAAMAALKLLKDCGKPFGVNWVARRDNIDDFPAFIEAMRVFNPGNINILRYKPSPKEPYGENCLPPEKLAKLAKIMKNTRGVRLKADSAFSGLLCHINGRASFMGGCGAGRRFMALDSGGYFRPCSHVHMKEKAGSLRHVWYNSKHLEMFRLTGKKVAKPCAGCDYLHGCYGCRCAALAQSGDFYGGDAGCNFTTIYPRALSGV